MVFVSLMGLMHEDQSLLPENYTFLGCYSLIFTHACTRRLKNLQCKVAFLKTFLGVPVGVMRDNKNPNLPTESNGISRIAE